jgi:hypothetical protein
MVAKRRLLVAVTAMGYVHMRRALRDSFDLVPAFSMLQAVVAIEKSDADAILCSVHFDDSRMFELLELASAVAPRVPFVCCRILHSDLDRAVLAGLPAATGSLGALGFVDYNDLHRQLGAAEADRRFLEELRRLLPPSATELKTA